jgi:hypothetical protein
MRSGIDSRRSMSGANVEMSQNLAMVRHMLAREDKFGVPDPQFKNGFCVIFYGIQSPGRLDKTIRDCTVLTIFKSYYDEIESRKGLNPDDIQFIKNITKDSKIKHKYSARGSGLGITKTKETMRIYFPKTAFKIPVILPPPERYQAIIDALIKMDLDETDLPILRGWLRTYSKENNITLSGTDMAELIELARYQQWAHAKSLEKIITEADIQTALNEQRMIVIDRMRGSKLGWRTIGKAFDMNHTTLYNEYRRWSELHKSQDKESEKAPANDREKDGVDWGSTLADMYLAGRIKPKDANEQRLIDEAIKCRTERNHRQIPA